MRVLVPLPDRDFDTTEVAVPWRLLTDAGIEVVFATEHATEPACDPLLLTGVLFGQLGAEPEPRRFYESMRASRAFREPIAWADIDTSSFDGLLLAGGHAKGMRQYLESTTLQNKVLEMWRARRPVAAICHGVIVLARTIDPQTGKSVLYDRRTTCLPKYMEKTAWYTTRWKLGDYYRTYPEYVEDEVRGALAHADQLLRGPIHLFSRGTMTDDGPSFLVEDGHYISARWPGDAYRFGRAFIAKLRLSRRAGADAGASASTTR